jgi:hypothetical protein
MTTRPPRETIAPKLMPHLAEPIEAVALAARVDTTLQACESALKAMHRKGMVRKIVRRESGQFIAHLWVAA